MIAICLVSDCELHGLMFADLARHGQDEEELKSPMMRLPPICHNLLSVRALPIVEAQGVLKS